MCRSAAWARSSGELARAARLPAPSCDRRRGHAISPDGDGQLIARRRRVAARTTGAQRTSRRRARAARSATTPPPKPGGRAGQGQHALRRCRGCATRRRSAGGVRRHVPHQRDVEPARRRVRARRPAACPTRCPCEIYCHSLTDPSILCPSCRRVGAQTLTVFGLHVPDRLHARSRRRCRRAVAGVSLELGARRADRAACCSRMPTAARRSRRARPPTSRSRCGCPGGNIFHGPLSWPLAEDDDDLSTPAERWGVATAHDRILLCGSGARRGGAVSGIGGHNAAMAVLEN